MLRITDGVHTLLVSKGAFREIYSIGGWAEVKDPPEFGSQRPAEASVGQGGSKPAPEPMEGSEGPYTASVSLLSYEEREALSSMSKAELRQYASLLGIKMKNLKTKERLTKAIELHLIDEKG